MVFIRTIGNAPGLLHADCGKQRRGVYGLPWKNRVPVGIGEEPQGPRLSLPMHRCAGWTNLSRSLREGDPGRQSGTAVSARIRVFQYSRRTGAHTLREAPVSQGDCSEDRAALSSRPPSALSTAADDGNQAESPGNEANPAKDERGRSRKIPSSEISGRVAGLRRKTGEAPGRNAPGRGSCRNGKTGPVFLCRHMGSGAKTAEGNNLPI